jgi:ribosomal protein S18 acetylase RimI-like enzyme
VEVTRGAAVDLGTGWVDDARRVLAAAFATDPTVRYVCDAGSGAFERRLHALYALLVRVQIESGEPRLGVFESDRLVAVCHLLRPTARIPLRLEAMHAIQIVWGLGPGALVRGGRFARAVAGCHPATPHYYVVSIGVDPASQGHGHGGVLLRAVHERSEVDPRSAGVALDTQNPRNVDLYARFGYRVTREGDIGPLHSWCMFRPNQRTTP